ncbi:MAG: uracil-DNA glycosylase [Anaerolineales bacterium]|nr:uracil-DNA glycosylase [Anaerolineales bacterium]
MAQTLSDLEERIIACRRCPRLVEWRERIGREKRRAYREEDYWAKPVPGFGDSRAAVLAVGLAPGAHGSNRTGRMFTGDASGDFLYPALFRAGFADRPKAVARGDGLTLRGLFLTALCRCAPPDNKPAREEIRNCLPFLLEEIRLLERLHVLVALGRVAYDTLSDVLAEPSGSGRGGCGPKPAFAHGAVASVPGLRKEDSPLWLVGSYHPSRQNTQTGRLTRPMFDRIWKRVRELARS